MVAHLLEGTAAERRPGLRAGALGRVHEREQAERGRVAPLAMARARSRVACWHRIAVSPVVRNAGSQTCW